MKNNLKKLLCAALSAAVVAGTVVLPTVAGAADWSADAGTWKFDFGSADNIADGYIGVSADKDYTENSDYGFLGLGDKGYTVSERTDSFNMKKGQKITLKNGAKETVASANDDCVGVTAAAEPIRFAMNTTNNRFFKVKAVLMGADPSKDANVSLYSEKRHPIVTETNIAAGETLEVEFTATVQNVYYQKSDPNGIYTDDQLNVVVLGENAGLASLEITELKDNDRPVTLWAYTDSTGCDQSAAFPYFKLQDCSGVAQSLSKYLSKDIAVSNQGEGGLTADDNLHWNCANANIQAGDYVYVEFGHNHKSDGPTGYANAIKKYYEKAHSVGAYTIFVSPCDRHNETNGKSGDDREVYYNAETNTWKSTLSGFGDAAKAYVDGLIADGETDVAYIDLNTASLRWMEQVCEDVKTKRGASKYEANATNYYFQGIRNGGVDGTHPNDAGSDNLAYCVMQEAKKTVDADANSVQGKVLAGLVDGMRDASPYVIPKEIVDAGPAPNSKYPVPFVVADLPALPNVIKDITIENGAVTSAVVLVRDAVLKMDAYGIVVITITDKDGNEKGKIYAKSQVDNSTGFGTQTITEFDAGGITIEDTDTYKAIVMKAKDSGNGLIVDEEANLAYSAVYEPTDIDEFLTSNEDEAGVERFVYTGLKEGDEITKATLGNWHGEGSAGRTITIGTIDKDSNYLNLITDGIKNGAANQGSFYVFKDLVKSPVIKTSGKYLIDMDMQYISGGGLSIGLADGANTKNPWGTQSLYFYTVNADGKIKVDDKEAGSINQTEWTNVKCILDMDMGTLSVSAGGGTPVVKDLDNYKTAGTDIQPTQLTQLMFSANKVAVGIKVANVTVAKMKQTLPEYTATAKSSDSTIGYATVIEGKAMESDAQIAYFKNTDGQENGSVWLINRSQNPVRVTGIAVYRDENGILKSAETFGGTTTGGTEQGWGVNIKEGAELYSWDWELNKLQPMADMVKALPETLLTKTLNSLVTYKAVPKSGYVFMGWLDKSGTKVSDDAVYTFRLRADTELTASFVKEPSVEDVTTFALSADKTSVKAVAGTVVNVNITDAKDADGTPIGVVQNKDAEWLCDEAGITVEDGVVTFGDDFDMGDAETKTITVKATLNGIEKSCSILATVYDYYEDFSGDLAKANWFTNMGAGSASISDGALKTVGSGGSNNTYTGTHFAAPEAVNDKLVTIKFDYSTTTTGTGNAASSIHIANMALTDNAPTWETTYSTKKNMGTDFKAGSEGIGLTANTAYEITIVINNKTKKYTVTAQPESGDALQLAEAGSVQPINTIFFRPGKGITDTIDNVRVIISDAE